MSNPSTGPVVTLKDHFVKAAVWENDSKNGPFYSTTIERTYKDGDEYKTSHSFSSRETLVAGVLMIQAYLEQVKLEAADFAANDNRSPAPAQTAAAQPAPAQ